jgi:hypothetical protein
MRTVVPVPAPAVPTYGKLKAGDTVIVQTADGKRWRFVVQQIDGDSIIARGGQRYTRGEIVKLQRKSFSGPKTAGLIAGIAAGIFLVAGIAVASALDSLLG